MRPCFSIAAAGIALAGCAKDDHQRPELRATLDQAQITLADSIGTAVATRTDGAATEAALLVGGDPVFRVGVLEVVDLYDVRIAIISGGVLSSAPVGPGTQPCPGSIDVRAALAIAEQHRGGEAVAVVPDDDVACAFEIQVLVEATLWEVKVAGDGAVIEYELSDEYGGGEDDD